MDKVEPAMIQRENIEITEAPKEKKGSKVHTDEEKREAVKKLAVASGGLGSIALDAVSMAAMVTGSGAVAAGTMAASFFLKALNKKYDSMPVNKNIAPVEPVSDTWKNRPKANMVKWLMKQSETSLEEIAAYLGCSVSYLNNKLTRESFSFEDLLLAAYACGYTFVLVNNNEEISSEDSFRVDLLKHFDNDEGKEVLERIYAIEEEKKKAKRAEYEAKKAELERMKAEYGFED